MRKALNLLVPFFTAAAALVVFAILGGIIWAIASRGWAALNWSFFTEQFKLVGAEGGILWNLIGTLILILSALVVCVPLAMGIALLQGCYLSVPWRGRINLVLQVMNGMPTILFGLFGLIVFVKWMGLGKSWVVGGLVLGMTMLPTVAAAFSARIAALPPSYLDAALGLGLTRSQTVWSVVVPQSLGGILTGSLLGLARAAGETAPIMFTATIFAGATFPKGFVESPVLTLPYHIFILAQDSFDPSVGTKLWGAALVLLGLVFSFSLAALPMRMKVHEAAHE